MTIRSKHNNLLNYFIHDHQDLSPAYVRSCERFLQKLQATAHILPSKYINEPNIQNPSRKRQAPSATERPQLESRLEKC